MKKYVGPYVDYSDGIWSVRAAYGRRYLNGCISLVYQYVDGSWTHVNNSGKAFKTMEEAKTALDRLLLKEGAIFLTEEQFTRLELLK